MAALQVNERNGRMTRFSGTAPFAGIFCTATINNLYSAQSWARRQTLFHLPRPNVRVILPLLHQPGFDRIVKDVPLILAHIRPSANDPFEVAAQPNGIAVVEHFLDLVRRKALNNIHDFR